MKYIPVIQLPELSEADIDAGRWYSESYSETWYEQRIPEDLMQSQYGQSMQSQYGQSMDESSGYYEKFCIWFTENCEGHWALPRSHSLLFTHEEDQVKFILKFL